jgi:hypothetical protein
MKNSILILLALSVLTVACNKSEDFYGKAEPIESVNSTGGDEGGGDTSGSQGGSAGGTVGGSSDGQNKKVPVDVTENFLQKDEAPKKLDIVWIVDNSGSMADEQTALATNFDSFIKEFILKDVDFKMAITTTDTSSDAKRGAIAGASDLKLTSAIAKANEAQFISDFKSIIKVGVNGSGNERGLDAAEGFLMKHKASFLRPDAYLAIVIISDEEDSSPKAPAEYADILKASKANAGLVKVYSVVDTGKTNVGNNITTGYERYDAVSKLTAGVTANIRNDFDTVLTEMGDSIIGLLDSFALGADPIAGTLKVYVNNQLSNDYVYNAATRSIKFNSNALPPVGASIKVVYQKL